MKDPVDHPLSLQEFIDVPEPRSRTQLLRLSMSKYDVLSQNEALKRALGGPPPSGCGSARMAGPWPWTRRDPAT